MIPSPIVFREQQRAMFERRPGVRSVHLVTAESGTRELLNGITEFEPGASLPMHTHNCEETVHVLSGQATFEADGRTWHLESGDTTWTPADAPHRFVNRGADRLRILWTYGSAQATRTILDSGVTTSIADEGLPPP